MQVYRVAFVLAVAALAAAPPLRADLISKEYAFKPGVILEVGESNADGLRIDNVRFDVPSKVSGRMMRAGGVFSAEVALSSTADQAIRAGVAIALFDDQNRLVGVASGGNRIGTIQPGRQKSFTLMFDGVNDNAVAATRFFITAETKQ